MKRIKKENPRIEERVLSLEKKISNILIWVKEMNLFISGQMDNLSQEFNKILDGFSEEYSKRIEKLEKKAGINADSKKTSDK